MKNTLLSILGLYALISTASASPLGGIMVSEKLGQVSVYLECIKMENTTCLEAVIVTEVAGVKTPHEVLTVPMGNDFDQYSDRWGVFNELGSVASIRMPLIPEFRYLFLMNLSVKAYRDAFKVLESSEQQGKTTKIRALFFEKLLEVISEA